MITVLAGGVGAARLLRGLIRAVPPGDVTVVANVGDDLWLHGLRVCPDLDTITYTLAGVVHPEQGWGRADESFTIAAELPRYGAATWFTLGDRDLALHVWRTERLHGGAPLSVVTAEVAAAWDLGVAILPATDDEVATRVRTADGRDRHFQEYWVRDRADGEVVDVVLSGAEDAAPAPRVLDAIAEADVVLVAPSNPVVSIRTILDVPGVEAAVRATAAPVVGISPIVGGQVVRGMADRLLPAVGAEVSAAGVARWYGDLLDGWVIDEADGACADELRALGLDVAVTDTMMDDPDVAARLARTALVLARHTP